jgi:hypothetical protein
MTSGDDVKKIQWDMKQHLKLLLDIGVQGLSLFCFVRLFLLIRPFFTLSSFPLVVAYRGLEDCKILCMLLSAESDVRTKYDVILDAVCADYAVISEPDNDPTPPKFDYEAHAVRRAVLSWHLMRTLMIQAREDAVVDIFTTVEMNVLPILAEMEHTGIAVRLERERERERYAESS